MRRVRLAGGCWVAVVVTDIDGSAQVEQRATGQLQRSCASRGLVRCQSANAWQQSGAQRGMRREALATSAGRRQKPTRHRCAKLTRCTCPRCPTLSNPQAIRSITVWLCACAEKDEWW